ncbi:MAG: hypothetical protein JNM17_39790 [Archangium sp.]|nr:hypothetical protein [Archangium sp.]
MDFVAFEAVEAEQRCSGFVRQRGLVAGMKQRRFGSLLKPDRRAGECVRRSTHVDQPSRVDRVPKGTA